MAVGQVSFHNEKLVKRGRLLSSELKSRSLPTVYVQTRENAVVNRLNKTKIEREVDHEGERQARLKDEGRRKKAEAVERVGPGRLCPWSPLTGHSNARSPNRRRLGKSRKSSGHTTACSRRKPMRNIRPPRTMTMTLCERSTADRGETAAHDFRMAVRPDDHSLYASTSLTKAETQHSLRSSVGSDICRGMKRCSREEGARALFRYSSLFHVHLILLLIHRPVFHPLATRRLSS